MTEIHPAAHEPHSFHTLVSWPAVIAGAVVAVALGAMLNLLGVAIGAAALDPFNLGRGDTDSFGAGAGVWVALANGVALFVGAAVAVRSAKYPDHHRGLLQGLAVWAVAFLLAILVAGSSAAGGFAAVLGGVSERADVADVADTAPYYDPAVGPAPLPGEVALPVDPSVAAAADDAADATAGVALWAFLTMLIGVVAAVLGARYGGRRHGWETKARVAEGPVHASGAAVGPGGVSVVPPSTGAL